MVFENLFSRKPKTPITTIPSTVQQPSSLDTDKNKQRDEEEKLYTNSTKNFDTTLSEDYGYFFFPERFGKIHPITITERLFSLTLSREHIRKVFCREHVLAAIENDPLVKTLTNALEDHGCKIDLSRHIICEYCDPEMPGGFDPTTNQIIVCYNQQRKTNECLINGLVQAFDYCRAKYNFHDMKHFGCSLIRSINFTSCGFIKGTYSSYKIKDEYEKCVFNESVLRLRELRAVEKREAENIIKEVYTPCRNDLEPFGRIPKLTAKYEFIHNDYQRMRKYFPHEAIKNPLATKASSKKEK